MDFGLYPAMTKRIIIVYLARRVQCLLSIDSLTIICERLFVGMNNELHDNKPKLTVLPVLCRFQILGRHWLALQSLADDDIVS